MADCNPIITFKGKKYSYAEFASMLHDGLIDVNELKDMLDKGINPKVNEEYKIPETFGKKFETSTNEQTKNGSRITGIKKEIVNAQRDALGLEPIPALKFETNQELMNKAKEIEDNNLALEEGSEYEDINDIVNFLLTKKSNPENAKTSPLEEARLLYHKAKIDKAYDDAVTSKTKLEIESERNPDDTTLEMDLATAKVKARVLLDMKTDVDIAAKISGNAWSGVGNVRQVEMDIDKLQIVNDIKQIENLYGNKMPNELRDKLKELENTVNENNKKIQILEQEARDRAAAEFINTHNVKVNKGGKLKVSQTKEARQAKIDEIKNRIKANLFAKSGTINTTLPFAEQAIKIGKIAPDVILLAKEYVADGITKLSDVIDKIQGDFETLSKDDVRDILAGVYTEKGKTRDELTKEFQKIKSEASLRRKIDNIEKGIIEKTKTKGETSEEVKSLQKELADAKRQAKKEFANFAAAELEKQAEQIKKQILKGEFEKKIQYKSHFEKDESYLKAKAKLENTKKEVKKELHKIFEDKKTNYMLFLDWVNRLNRRAIFFLNDAVMVKLAASATTSAVLTQPAEFLIGKGLSKNYPKIAEKARGEANQSVKSFVKFYTELLDPKKFFKNTLSQVATGETELSKQNSDYQTSSWELPKTGNEKMDKILSEFYKKEHVPLIDIYSDMHVVLKDPLKRAKFEMNFMNELDAMRRNELDYTDPLLVELARQRSYNLAKSEILMGKSKKFIGDEFSKVEQKAMEELDKGNKTAANALYTKIFLYRMIVPIASVPYNLIKTSTLYTYRLRKNLKMLREAEKDINEAFNKMDENTANQIFFEIKKGSVASAYWILGAYLAYNNLAGGLFTFLNDDKKRVNPENLNPNDYPNGVLPPNAIPKSGELKIVGHHVPHGWQHSWAATALQGGATFTLMFKKSMRENEIKNPEKFWTNLASAAGYLTVATGGALASQLPVFKESVNIANALTTPSGYKREMKSLENKFTYKTTRKNLKEFKADLGLDTTTKQ